MPCDRACEFFFLFFISTSDPFWWDFHRRSRLSAQLNADWRRIASKSGRVYLCKTRSKAVDTRVSYRAEKSATIDGNIPVKGNGRFPPHWSSQIRDQGILGKGGRIYNFWQERWFTNDPIDSTRGEGGIFWNWDNREIFIPANNVPRSLSKHQDSLLSSIIEPGQRNFLIPSNVKRILEFYLAMNHSRISLRNRCFLLSSRVERERQLNLGLRNQIRGIELRSTRGFAGKGEDWQRSVQNYRSSAECCSHGNISLLLSLSLSGERVHPPFVARQLKLALLITRCRDAC